MYLTIYVNIIHLVAISLTEQVQSEPVPVDEHDVKLDKILTCDEDIE